jgi:hypothetical protein
LRIAGRPGDLAGLRAHAEPRDGDGAVKSARSAGDFPCHAVSRFGRAATVYRNVTVANVNGNFTFHRRGVVY